MKRNRIDIEAIASYENLADAAVKAAKGKQHKKEVQLFFNRFDHQIALLRVALLNGKAPFGIYHRFKIHDPKERTIHAACFRDQIMHHALINLIGPILDRTLVSHTFACRTGKGVHKAVQRVQDSIQKYEWYVKIDIRKYFDSIDHTILKRILRQRLKGEDLLKLIDKIIDSYEVVPNKGLPIGSLTSQHFANFYLNGADRLISEKLKGKGGVRYMDDFIWFCSSKFDGKDSLKRLESFLRTERALSIKDNWQINHCQHGVTFCGFRILKGMIKMSPYRKKRYTHLRKKWELAFLEGKVDALKLQSTYASIFSLTSFAHGRGWRKAQSRHFPAIEV